MIYLSLFASTLIVWMRHAMHFWVKLTRTKEFFCQLSRASCLFLNVPDVQRCEMIVSCKAPGFFIRPSSVQKCIALFKNVNKNNHFVSNCMLIVLFFFTFWNIKVCTVNLRTVETAERLTVCGMLDQIYFSGKNFNFFNLVFKSLFIYLFIFLSYTMYSKILWPRL